jgi:hypothetical protein
MRKLNPPPSKEGAIIYPCELQRSILIDGNPCKYILDVIDGEVYGTNSFSLYHLYVGMFFEEEPEKIPQTNISNLCRTLATPESWKNAMEQEKKRYTDGYHYVLNRKKQWTHGKWVKKKEGSMTPWAIPGLFSLSSIYTSFVRKVSFPGVIQGVLPIYISFCSIV